VNGGGTGASGEVAVAASLPPDGAVLLVADELELEVGVRGETGGDSPVGVISGGEGDSTSAPLSELR